MSVAIQEMTNLIWEWMVMKKITLSIVIVGLLISGCAPKQINLTINSNPQGADIFENSRHIGRTPSTFAYAVKPQNKQMGYIQTSPLMVKWISGATSQAVPLTLHLNTGEHQSYSFQRPNVEGYEKDARFGLDVERNQQAHFQNMIGVMGILGN